MRLRRRLALTLAVAIVPSVLGLLYADAAARHRAAQERLVGFVSGHLDDESQWRCEANPATWGTLPQEREGRGFPPPPRDGSWRDRPPPDGDFGGPPPGEMRGPPPDLRGPPEDVLPATLIAYDAEGHSLRPSAPSLDPALFDRARREGLAYVPWHLGHPEVGVLMRTGFPGSCAFALGQGGTSARWGALLPQNPVWLLPLLAVYAAVLLSMGPLVGRVRRLTRQVERLQAHARDDEARAVAGEELPEPALTIEGADEITDLARAFDASARTARTELRDRVRSEQALRDFLANTTHDVMIPLTVLQGHLATLRESHDPAVVRAAMDEAHYLGSLLHNLAIASKVDAAEPALHPGRVELGELVRRVISRHRPVAAARGIELDGAWPDAPLATSADVTVLEQAVSNVVYNAVRYNHEGGHVAVLVEEDAGTFRIRVLDDGPGIPPSERARLLVRGARGDAARTRSPEGQGLGLYIARRAAELHEFELTLAESEFGGLEVGFRGPLLSADPAADGAG